MNPLNDEGANNSINYMPDVSVIYPSNDSQEHLHSGHLLHNSYFQHII